MSTEPADDQLDVSAPAPVKSLSARRLTPAQREIVKQVLATAKPVKLTRSDRHS